MGEFIRVEVNMQTCAGIKKCGGCVRVCPVNIFGAEGEAPVIIEANEDECILCELCLRECDPRAIVIHRRYDD